MKRPDLDWRRLRETVESALDLELSQRDAYLVRALAGRPDLAARAQRLLDSAEASATPLDRDALELLGERPVPGAGRDDRGAREGADLVGREVSGYRVQQHLSSGGMGDVYLAEPPVGAARARVALKVLKRGLDTDAALARFRIEREALAALHHDGIVAFLDAGALEDGRPFLVMEYVEGLPLGEFAASRALSIDQRLELFLEICDAVAFAHGQLVLHRDLKPSNVLVTAQGRPKLCDFGVAKILEAGHDATHTGAPAPWTPRYAAPEQVRGERASVATDVHGLGLLLHELLAGRPALSASSPAARLESAGPPPPPSAALAGRGGDGRRAARAVRGDLDAICSRALETDPARRYASVEALAADVRRHRAGEAVSARRAALTERALRVLRRHRGATLALAGLVLVLLAAAAGAWMGMRRAERDAAHGWSAHGQAKRAARFLEELVAEGFAAADVEAFSNADARAARELAHLAEADALVRMALGRAALEARRPAASLGQLLRAEVRAGSERSLGRADRARLQGLLLHAWTELAAAARRAR